jgi:flagellar motility protein MotE (MotC chaperone)
MELSKEFITEHELSETVVTAINGLNASNIAELKKGWDGKANADANAILDGAAGKVSELTGLARKEGEKIADYFNNAWNHHSTSRTQELDKLKSDYEEKMKSAGSNETLTKEYEALKEKVENHYKKIEVDYNEVKPFKEMYETSNNELTTYKLDLAFNSNKPTFPSDVNEYESTAKWNEFKSDVLNKYNIEIVDGVAKAINKDNKHDVVNLKDLVTQNETLTELLKEREQGGLKAKSAKAEDVEGVPFKVPVEATSAEIGELVRTHLATKNLDVMSADYSKQYSELYMKIKNRQQTAA